MSLACCRATLLTGRSHLLPTSTIGTWHTSTVEHSHWSRSIEMLLRPLCYKETAQGNQGHQGHYLPFAVSLWHKHKGGIHHRKVSTLRTRLLHLLRPLYQLTPLWKLVQTLGVVDVKNKEESVPFIDGLDPEYAVLLLAGSVVDVQQTDLLVNN